VIIELILQDAEKSCWFIENLYWIIPSLLSLGAIIAVALNTNKQIKNQNKEQHKPYLVVKSFNTKLKDAPPSLYNEYSIYNSPDKFEDYPKGINSILKIKNIGYGLATNIVLYGIHETIAHRIEIDEEDEAQYYSVKHISPLEIYDWEIMVSPKKERSTFMSTTFDIMMFYTDVNLNVYSTLISITMPGRSKITFHPKNSRNFKILLNEHQTNYKKLLRKYKNDNF
jgi:hypothetical protein